MENRIDIYVIKSENLIQRKKGIELTLNKLKTIMKKSSYDVNIIYITSPTDKEIELNLSEYNNKINLKDEIEDNDFKQEQTKFNLAQISNLYKHRKAYEMINNSMAKHNFIIEDDIILLDEYINNFSECLELIKRIEYDILFTCISNNTSTGKINIELTTTLYKILIMKSSYFINKDTAKKLYDYLDIIRFPIRISISKYIYDNKNTIKSYILNKHTLFEGSKLGIYSSTTKTSNFLIQNNYYIDMINILKELENDNNKDENNEIINKGIKHCKLYGNDNPEFQHLLGLMFYKKNRFLESLETMKSSIYSFKKNEGFVPQFNEILNNCINMHKYCQTDIEECFNKPSIYSP
jgi:GR25 family glycosyltransferase involved in LPS biosynthesis